VVPTSWRKSSPGFHLNVPNAIDPLALILPESLYVAINKPYPPTRAEIVGRLRAVTKGMPREDKTRLRNRAKAVGAYVALVEQALTDDAATQD